MAFPPDGAARSLCLAADEALTAAAFCTGDFAEADRLFTEAQSLAARSGDWAGEAFAVGGLGMVLHHRNIPKLIEVTRDGSPAPWSRWARRSWPRAIPGAPPSG